MSEPRKETSWLLRPADQEDEGFLHDLFYQLHAGDFAGTSLPEEQVLGLVQMQARAQRLSYLRDFPAARSSIVVVEGKPVGRLLVDHRSDSIRLVDVALLAEWRARGIGARLLQNLQSEAQEHGVPLRLTVQPRNPALRLYSRLGFAVTGAGLQLEMEWLPEKDHTTLPSQLKPARLGANEILPVHDAADPVVVLPTLTGRKFLVGDLSLELVLDRVKHHRTVAKAFFSLFFAGPLETVVEQGNYTLHLLNSSNQPEREFLIFLVPVGPATGRMEYEAVFSI